ncbi:DNA repair exonuclease SbcCD nuclease subunit [Salirhabdus euzebyi]|uniref:DNA repair exonuclease SbcCD nuclease subunit n=1 Tax=Salirhabdus euzebyi TaxID=394506 RepID=A0A841Q880_9BACI|nr:DNA repair exonuclease [Salirhabdus euzebyi]MBB6454661.1 DNA repair exonuclease SbcCD nuclease subunit [Salirhabdus euzebyi]
MKKALRFIHSADLHLDSPFKGLSHVPTHIFEEIKQSTFKAFDRIIDLAIKQEVDFVLFVGDLFDENARSLKAQMKVKKGLEKLKQHHIAVFISYGNHDFVNGDYYDVDFPDNVQVFQSEKVDCFPFYKGEEHVANIYGFSYENRAVTEPKVKEYTITSEAVYHIGMLHGSLSTNNEHDVYAPFLLSDLQQKNIDYWALGHIHKREQLQASPSVLYSGNIQGRHIKETGEKGVYVVDLDQNETYLSFHSTQVIRFEQESIDVTDCRGLDELESILSTYKEEWREQYGKAFIRLQLTVDQEQLGNVNLDVIRELTDVLNEIEEEEQKWVWLESIQINNKVSWDRAELLKGNHFTGELLRTIQQTTDLETNIEELTANRDIKKYVGSLSDDELAEIKEHAETLLLQELLKD